MKESTVEEFSKYMRKLKEQADAKEECDGCDGCEDIDLDEDMAAMVSAIEMTDDPHASLEAAFLMLMVVAKKTGLAETSRAAHELWVNA